MYYRVCSDVKREVLDDGFVCPRGRVQDSFGRVLPHPTYAHPEDCAKFYICRNGIQPQKGQCQNATVYNEQEFKCMEPKDVPGWWVLNFWNKTMFYLFFPTENFLPRPRAWKVCKKTEMLLSFETFEEKPFSKVIFHSSSRKFIKILTWIGFLLFWENDYVLNIPDVRFVPAKTTTRPIKWWNILWKYFVIMTYGASPHSSRVHYTYVQCFHDDPSCSGDLKKIISCDLLCCELLNKIQHLRYWNVATLKFLVLYLRNWRKIKKF